MTGELARERMGDLLARVCELRHRCMHEQLDDLGLYKGQPLMLRALWAQDGITQSELTDRLAAVPVHDYQDGPADGKGGVRGPKARSGR